MLTRTISLFGLGLAALLFAASQTEAQPGKGKGKGQAGKGAEGGTEIEKLQRDVNRLMDQLKDTQARIADLKRAGGDGRGQFGGKGGGGGPGGFGPGMRGGMPGMPGMGWAQRGEKLDAETIKERYDYYKKLYDESKRESKGKGKEGGKGGPGGMGGGGGSGGSVEARIDRLIRELEQLRSEVRGSSSGGGKGPGGKKKERD